MVTMANSEDTDEMPHNVTLYKKKTDHLLNGFTHFLITNRCQSCDNPYTVKPVLSGH